MASHKNSRYRPRALIEPVGEDEGIPLGALEVMRQTSSTPTATALCLALNQETQVDGTALYFDTCFKRGSIGCDSNAQEYYLTEPGTYQITVLGSVKYPIPFTLSIVGDKLSKAVNSYLRQDIDTMHVSYMRVCDVTELTTLTLRITGAETTFMPGTTLVITRI